MSQREALAALNKRVADVVMTNPADTHTNKVATEVVPKDKPAGETIEAPGVTVKTVAADQDTMEARAKEAHMLNTLVQSADA